VSATTGRSGTELWGLGAAELAAAIRERRVSSREAVRAHLDRIEAIGARVNAVVRVLGEEALSAADAADRRLQAGDEVGTLHGVPITVKENIDLAGTPTTQAVAAMSGAVPAVDAPHVAHLRAAGAIPIGRTNLPDFALRWHTDNAVYGATINPWDASRTAGGSSGGEGAALATGMTPLGLGNDLGGSLRWPAQCNGICSLKPTLGRIPQASAIEPVDSPISIQLMAVQGPMARHVADLRLALGVMSQPSTRDPWYVPVPVAGLPLAPGRVAVVVDPAEPATSPQVAAGVRRAAGALREAGYDVEEVAPPDVAKAARTWLDMIAAELRIMWRLMSPLVSDDANQFMSTFLELNPPIGEAGYVQTFMARQAIGRTWAEFQQAHPLVLAPISTEPPFTVGMDLDADGVSAILSSMPMVVAINLLGLPAVAVPAGVEGGLPQVVQVIGPRFREDLCLAAAEAIEAACGIPTPIDPR
jgi:amidase